MIFKKYSKGTIEKNKDFKWQGWIESTSGRTIAFVELNGNIVLL